MEQISLKIPVKQLENLQNYAEHRDETHISYHNRPAIAEYLENHN